MTEDYGEGNLIPQTEAFLNEVFGSWKDSLKALETCEEVVPYAEEIHIVSRCIDSLAMKACADPKLLNATLLGQNETNGVMVWNGISVATKPETLCNDWWFEDISLLNLPLFKRLILAIESKGMKPEIIAASLIHYANKYLPLMNNKQSSINDMNRVSFPSEADQKALLEEIVTLLPDKKGATSPKVLLRLLGNAVVLHASTSCRENLEKRIGAQLDEAVLVDLLIPNVGYSVETLYDIDCVQRILDHFMSLHQETTLSNSPCIVEEGQFLVGTDTITPVTMVASLVDGFLAEVAPDVNLKLSKFQLLAATIPDYARPLDDGLYRAIDVYLKAHPWLTDLEREQLCRLMNCQKLSLEASTHAAQNERLPLRVIVQVLFFEQLRLRTSISAWFFVSENLTNSQNHNGNLASPRKDVSCPEDCPQDHTMSVDMKEQISDSELEKECSNMNQEFQKLEKTKRKWKIFSKKFSFRQPCNSKKSCDLKEPESSTNGQQNHEDGDMPQ
ncbi:BTB/POZ domain-containing protein At5g03250 isoform X2 [Jatropha curcas]|nr:BTB/POZ domain-containing protein At5g03250 isoform X2 [Jatropha curcas]XP_020538138.1 BTB/POZ domain-containing protein At5g03250 isoform X2 [Jatropha curcas]